MTERLSQPSTGPNVQSQALFALIIAKTPDPARIEAMLNDFGDQISGRLLKAAQHRIYVTSQYLT